jgi:hypothetical protein
MVSYRRNRIAGGKFFTADLRDRRQKVLIEHIDVFRNVIRGVRRALPLQKTGAVITGYGKNDTGNTRFAMTAISRRM